MSTRALADGVMELSRALTEHSRQLKERGVERQRLEGVQAEFHRHLRWQQQRIQALQHDIKRLKNESAWLREKAGEVEQDTTIVSHEIRQCRTEMEQVHIRGRSIASTGWWWYVHLNVFALLIPHRSSPHRRSGASGRSFDQNWGPSKPRYVAAHPCPASLKQSTPAANAVLIASLMLCSFYRSNSRKIAQARCVA